MRVPRPLVCVITATSLIVLGHAAPNALARNNGQWENSLIYDSGFRGYDSPTTPLFRAVVRPTLMKLTFSRSTRTATSPSSRKVRARFRTGRKSPCPTTRLNGTKAIPPGTASSSSASKDRFIATLSLAECDRLRRLGRGLFVPTARLQKRWIAQKASIKPD